MHKSTYLRKRGRGLNTAISANSNNNSNITASSNSGGPQNISTAVFTPPSTPDLDPASPNALGSPPAMGATNISQSTGLKSPDSEEKEPSLTAVQCMCYHNRYHCKYYLLVRVIQIAHLFIFAVSMIKVIRDHGGAAPLSIIKEHISMVCHFLPGIAF